MTNYSNSKSIQARTLTIYWPAGKRRWTPTRVHHFYHRPAQLCLIHVHPEALEIRLLQVLLSPSFGGCSNSNMEEEYFQTSNMEKRLCSNQRCEYETNRIEWTENALKYSCNRRTHSSHPSLYSPIHVILYESIES